MSSLPSRCMSSRLKYKKGPQLTWHRFVDCEKWRAEYAGVGVEELVRTFDYKEKPEVFKYYPQYYHKTDKVGTSSLETTSADCDILTAPLARTAGPCTLNSSAMST